MRNNVSDFYNNLASEYKSIFKDWDYSVKWQADCIDNIIMPQIYTQRNHTEILDCSCGIGTQAIGLALLGYKVHASDLSIKEIERAKLEAARLGAELSFSTADFRTLNKQIEGTFHVVISFDNSLTHLLKPEELQVTFNNINEKLVDNGLFVASIRDYDKFLEERPKILPPYVHDDQEGRRIVVQVWDWNDDDIYKVNQYITKQADQECSTICNSTFYRAITREEISEKLSTAGFYNIHWMMPEETGFYQPIVTARKL
ncbi:MAG: class I SAM-dependent methyltransferase [Bacillota bacterium]|nr:class I SAM-dependent methyltransferase [Bacillota bacterium]